MKRDPQTRQRSPWTEDPDLTTRFREGGAEPDAVAYVRNVHDGWLGAVRGTIPNAGLHLSVTHRKHNGDPGRYPTWDEIAHARDELLPADKSFMMVLPRTDGDEYVAVYPTTFHLHEDLEEGEVFVGGIRWRVMFGRDDDGLLVTDDTGRLVTRLEPVSADLGDDAYLDAIDPEEVTGDEGGG